MTKTDTDDDTGGRHPERTSPARQTVEDAMGVERIVSREDGSWSPAPTEATANQKARAEAANAHQEEKREARLASLGLKDEKSKKDEGGTVADDDIATSNPTSSANAAAFPDRPPGEGDFTGQGSGDDKSSRRTTRKTSSSKNDS